MIVARLASGNAGEHVLYATRTFFGVYRVSEDLGGRYHELVHGTTQHGLQALAAGAPRRGAHLLSRDRAIRSGMEGAAAAPPLRTKSRSSASVSARSRATPRRSALDVLRNRSGRRTDRAHARVFFIHGRVRRSLPRRIGDARVSLSRVPEHTYDLLVLDAFSSDAIPMHLLTREAFGLYLSRLTRDGVLVLHISNRHLHLAPIVGRLAESHGLVALQEIDAVQPGGPKASKRRSGW